MRGSAWLALVLTSAVCGSRAVGAQSTEISLAVLPFGVLPGASGSAHAAPSLGEEVVGVVSSSGLYTVVDRSTDRAIEEELRKAEGFRNFDSRVQLQTTARLNVAVFMVGVIEQQTIDVHRATKAGERPSYTAVLGVRVKLVRTQTGELIKSAFFTLRNGAAASDMVKDTKLGKLIPKALQDAVAKQIDEKVTGAAERQNISVLAHTVDEAVRSAIGTIKKPLGEFLQTSYGAVVAASKAK